MDTEKPMTARELYYALGKELSRDESLGEASATLPVGAGEVAVNRLELGVSSTGRHIRIMPVS